ncbi:MAG: 30S ribosomal protein S9 [Candidatus Wildermuthbacteria bacterium]|nr:30S ribosomal protein S9 [Candidatus Wildermuthbacteria bacterium]
MASPSSVKKEEKAVQETEKYYKAIGRRKTAVARVRLFTQGEKIYSVNGKPLENYFPTPELQQIIRSPLEIMNCLDRFHVQSRVAGGGIHAQAEAVRHGIARALVLFTPDFRKKLKKAGFLKRDPRGKERKKFGLKRARKAPQWAKR